MKLIDFYRILCIAMMLSGYALSTTPQNLIIIAATILIYLKLNDLRD